MDVGANMAQWLAVGVALLLGGRAEVRARREGRQQTAKNVIHACATVTGVLGQAMSVLPANTAGITGVLHGGRDNLKQLSIASRQAVESVAPAFPSVGGGTYSCYQINLKR